MISPRDTLLHAIRRLALAVLPLAALLVPGAARSQGSIAAAWLDCHPNGAPNSVPSCQFDIGERRLYLSISPGQDIEQVAGWTLVVDLASNAPTLVDWWQVQPTGCRSGQIVAAMPTGLESGCLDSWSAVGAGLVQSVLYPRPGGDARQLRVVLVVGVPAVEAFSLAAGETYLAGVLALHFAKTVPPGECAGCLEPVCLVFNSAEVHRVPGAPGDPPQPFFTPMDGAGNQATWNDGSACATVPVRARTWGQIKSLFR